MSAKKPKPGSADDLAAQFPWERTITVRVRRLDGPQAGQYEEVSIRVAEMDLTQTNRAYAIVRPFEADLSASTDLMGFIAEHPEEAHALMAIATGWPAERVAVLAFGSWMAVGKAVVELNPGFFSLLLARLASVTRATIKTPTNGVGESPLPISGDTESPAPPPSH